MKKLAPLGVEVTVFHKLHALPVFSPDVEGGKTPVVVRNFMDAISAADGIIISSPEYIRAIPGGLKNAIDWMVSRFEVIDKPIVLVHASHRGEDMLASLRLVLATLSSSFFEHLFLRIPLIGKSPEDIMKFLCLPEHESKIRSFLLNFAAAFHQSSERPPNTPFNPDTLTRAG